MIAMYGLSNNLGGVEKSILRIVNNPDNDFALILREEFAQAKYLQNSKAEIYPVTLFRGVRGFIKNTGVLYGFFRKHPEIDVLHYHFMTYYNIQVLIAAKLAGIKKIILHIRGSQFTRDSIKGKAMHFINKPIAQLLATDFLACSEPAANFAYYPCIRKSNRYHVIHNGIELSRYSDLSKREQLRNKYDVQNKTVYGHVGAMLPVKNHKYLIDVFENILKKDPDSMLLLIGDGELRSQIEDYVRLKGITLNVIFTGNVPNVEAYYQMMDVLILPSISEGLPNVVIEAETNGVPCFVSDNVTEEIKVTDRVSFISISASPDETANSIISGMRTLKATRRVYLNEMKTANFDICDTIRQIENVYSQY